MKYIRTKDGRIFNKGKIICSAFREEYNSPNWNEDIEKYLQTKIVAEADTIEELCEEFVFIKGNIKLIFSPITYSKEKDTKFYDEIYGAIWTDKGLIYVAKMNDKGDLKLL